MRLVALEQLRPGDRLGKDVHVGPSATPLLRAGVRLGPSYIDGLRRAGVRGVYVDDDLSKGIDPVEPLRQETRRMAATALEGAFSVVTTGPQASATKLTDETIGTLKTVAEQIASEIAGAPDAVVALADLACVDAYTLQHSVDTTAVGVLLAHRHFTRVGWVDWNGRRRFDRIEQRLVMIGTGLLLHDIGKLAIPPEIVQKAGPLTAEEWEVMRTHPLLGHQMIAESQALSPLVKAVVRSHHERWDGEGYPHGKAGEAIPLFARIAAVADVLDAMTATRPYKGAAPVHVACEYIDESSGSQFDPDVVETFRRTIAPYPVGIAVRLSDGSMGIVAETPAAAVHRPVVRVVVSPAGKRVDPYEVDLRQAETLEVVEADVVLDRAVTVAA